MEKDSLIFVGGIDGKEKWLEDGKSYSRNYKQGNRVYHSEGIAAALSAQPVGGTGGFTSLYLINDNEPKGSDLMTKNNEAVPSDGKSFMYVSLFSGIGGFEQALNKLGGTCVMASEVDKFANQSYELLYGHKTVGDVTKVWEEDVPDHDLLVGGFPCPTFSVAGGRDGMEYRCQECGHEHLITFTDYKNGAICPECGGETKPKDERGVLFFEIARIAEAKQPKALLIENVKGLISSARGEVMRVITETLNQVGYTIDFDVLNSKYFGVPQNRQRVFVIGLRNDLAEPQEWAIKGTNVVAKGKRRLSEINEVKTFNFDWPKQAEVTTRLRDILEPVVNENYYLSEEKTEKLIAQMRDDNEPIAEGQVRPVLTPDRVEKRQNGRRFKDNDEEAFTLTTQDRHGILEGLPIREATKKGYAIASEGDAVNYQFPDSQTRRGRVGKQIANTLEASGINQGVVEAEVRSIGNTNPSGNGMNGQVYDIDAGLAPTLTTNKGEGSRITSAPHYRIRKLTPLECFRLQGFPDEAYEVLSANGISNAQLYKQAGNAVTVNVIDAIGRRLLPLIEEAN